MSRSCVFLDDGYFQKVLDRDFGKPKVDYGLIGPVLAAGREPLLRTYYYNCAPHQSNPPTDEDRNRTARWDRFHYAL